MPTVQKVEADVVDALGRIGQHDYGPASRLIKANERVKSTGAAVVPDNGTIGEPLIHQPGQGHG
jgi:hypothetical protein